MAGKCRKVAFRSHENGKPVSKNRVYQLRDGIFEAILDKFYTDPTLVAMEKKPLWACILLPIVD